MLRRAFGFFFALSFLASFYAPLCAAAPAAVHSCCAGRSRKAGAAPRCTCCRPALPSSAKPALPAPALAQPSPRLVSFSAAAPLAAVSLRFARGAAPPGPNGLSPPARAA